MSDDDRTYEPGFLDTPQSGDLSRELALGFPDGTVFTESEAIATVAAAGVDVDARNVRAALDTAASFDKPSVLVLDPVDGDRRYVAAWVKSWRVEA